jgi:NADPH2:quinone reductase
VGIVSVDMTDTDRMYAVAAACHGGPDVLRPVRIPRPQPKPDEVLIRVHGSSVNPADLRARRPDPGRRVLTRSFPLVLGYDVSGTVVQAGSTVANLRVGDEVFGSPSPQGAGAHAEYVAIDARVLARKPKLLSHGQAGAAPLVSLTAWQALVERARVEQGQTVLIHGGAGGVGHMAVQIAKAHGCRVLATAGRAASAALCRELGADEVIDYRHEDFVARTLALTDQRGADVVLDSVGGNTLARSALCTRPLGQVVTLVPTEFVGEAQAAFMRGITLHFVMMWTRSFYERAPAQLGRALTAIAGLFDTGRLRVIVAQRYPLKELAEAHRRLEQGGFQGKLAIDVASRAPHRAIEARLPRHRTGPKR